MHRVAESERSRTLRFVPETFPAVLVSRHRFDLGTAPTARQAMQPHTPDLAGLAGLRVAGGLGALDDAEEFRLRPAR